VEVERSRGERLIAATINARCEKLVVDENEWERGHRGG
jgi:hypothetical protein